MKAIAWQRFLEDQRRLHGKTVFTVTELANVSGSAPHALNVELARLQKQNLIVRYARGRYGLPEVVTPEALVPHLDAAAYVTGVFALHRHNLVTQVPVEITCFTNRRHNRSRIRATVSGRLTFVCVRPPIYAPPAEPSLAGPEQALCDLLWLLRRRGLAAENLVTFRRLESLDHATLTRVAGRYPQTVRCALATLVGSDTGELGFR